MINWEVSRGRRPACQGAISSEGAEMSLKRLGHYLQKSKVRRWVGCLWPWFSFSRMYHSGRMLRGDHPRTGCSTWEDDRRCQFWQSCFSKRIRPLLPVGCESPPSLTGQAPLRLWEPVPGVGWSRVALNPVSGHAGQPRLKLEDTELKTLSFLFKCCLHMQTSFPGAIWQRKWLYYVVGGWTGTDGRMSREIDFCPREGNIPEVEVPTHKKDSLQAVGELPFSGSICLAPSEGKPTPGGRLDELISTASSNSSVLLSSHLGSFQWTNIYWALTVWHAPCIEQLLYITSGLLRLSSRATHSCGAQFSADFNQLRGEAGWPGLRCRPASRVPCFLLVLLRSCVGCQENPPGTHACVTWNGGRVKAPWDTLDQRGMGLMDKCFAFSFSEQKGLRHIS